MMMMYWWLLIYDYRNSYETFLFTNLQPVGAIRKVVFSDKINSQEF